MIALGDKKKLERVCFLSSEGSTSVSLGDASGSDADLDRYGSPSKSNAESGWRLEGVGLPTIASSSQEGSNGWMKDAVFVNIWFLVSSASLADNV
jgi:hypothetical protein